MAEPIFPKTEFEQRWARARERMGRSGLRALVAYSPGNQFWLQVSLVPRAPDG